MIMPKCPVEKGASSLTKDETTKNAVARAKELLDGRTKAVKEATDNDVERVLTSFFAYGGNEYQIILDQVPEQDRPLLAECREALTGEVLQRTTGRNGFKLKSSWFNIYETETPTGNSRYRVDTTYRSVILDDSYTNTPLDQILSFNHQRCGYIKVISPYTQTKWLVSCQAPASRWHGVDVEDEMLTFEWLEIHNKLVQDNRYNRSIAPYNHDTFLCHDVDQAVRALNISAAKVTGAAFHYSVEFKDVHGRQGTTWGCRG
ncbi:hypothetical protein RM190_14485 [Paracoccus sp. CPCC 101403]|uniref:Uncharacterized protein n=1 Tax=Paracoccus broussonetiae TaxID=3075834 RepID=A0ABU3EG43_9RHOB|nr:hypothetical protein [Paracoccus sp. CPCC 101403]MDT1063081.1 hypothetical protein [Paracoccus sp. CPCC 101403]